MYLLRDTPLSDGKVGFAWDAAVGPALARATSVKLQGTVLLVEATSAQWALEVKRSTPTILQRLRSLLGDGAVTAISIRS
jgi:predicted nucleic acid-binding Zn ribbon protein